MTARIRQHIDNVQRKLNSVIALLMGRAEDHDKSKLQEPEHSIFEKYDPILEKFQYASKEYFDCMVAMKPALDHHYKNNSHHPQFYSNGIKGMSLLDLIEMITDWKAASERRADGSIIISINVNQQRFGYSDELKEIFYNTAIELKYITKEELIAYNQLFKN
jgi:hypothetical protein